MATNPVLRFRRSAAQLHALARVERTIRATDSKHRCKYLRDFTEAFKSYRRVLNRKQLNEIVASADVVLLGDYHALPASQRFASELLERMASSGRSVSLGVEAVVARDQRILDEWLQGEIDVEELRDRIRFDSDWGYDWRPFRELMETARRRAGGIFGLDCAPRADMRSIGARDRHAAAKIAELRRHNPESPLLVLFGESHLAPNHLPKLIAQQRPGDRIVTVLQNIDALYWRSAGEPQDGVEAVQVDDHTACVFTASPLEKYENYRLCIQRWTSENPRGTDYAPSFYNLIETLFRFLNINIYTTRDSASREFLVDLMPEVYCARSEEQLGRMLKRRKLTGPEIYATLNRVETRGSEYVAKLNLLIARDYRMPAAAEEAARFVHHACRGIGAQNLQPRLADDMFFETVLEHALGFVGSKVLCPGRKSLRDLDVYDEYNRTPDEVEKLGICGYREYLEMIDFLVLQKDYETHVRRYAHVPRLLQHGIGFTGAKFTFVTRKLGYLLGSQVYEAYLSGRISKRVLRNLFTRNLHKPGAARAAYYHAAQLTAPKAGMGSLTPAAPPAETRIEMVS